MHLWCGVSLHVDQSPMCLTAFRSFLGLVRGALWLLVRSSRKKKPKCRNFFARRRPYWTGTLSCTGYTSYTTCMPAWATFGVVEWGPGLIDTPQSWTAVDSWSLQVSSPRSCRCCCCAAVCCLCCRRCCCAAVVAVVLCRSLLLLLSR